METAKKQAASLRSADRVLEALATLAALLDRSMNEVRALDSEFQSRLLQAVHDTETSIQRQAADHLARTLGETEQRVRADVTTELRARFDVEVKETMEAIRREFLSERQGLNAELQRLNSELDRATQMGADWEMERSRLLTELARTQDALMAAQQEPAPAAPVAVQATTGVEEEILRVETALQEISALIDDPGTELSIVIRKNVERAELESYLRGIRFAVPQ